MPEIHEQQEILAIRNELIIKMLYCTGMRVSEIANLTVDQVELVSWIINKNYFG